MEIGQRRQKAAKRRALFPAVLHLLVGTLSISILALAFCAEVGLADWQQLAKIVGSPWNQVVNPWYGPKTTRLLAGEGLVYLLVWAPAFFAQRPTIVALVGRGSLVVLRRLIGFAWLPTLVATALLLRLDPSILRTQFVLRGDDVVLTLPTLAATIIFSLAALLHQPRIDDSDVRHPFGLLPDLLTFLIGIGMVVSLERSLAGAVRTTVDLILDALIVQATLFCAESTYVLTAIEAFLADAADVRVARSNGWAATFFPLARTTGRVTLFAGPVLVGLWLAIGATLPSASPILDRQGKLLDYYDRNGVFRLVVPPSEISASVYQAIDAVEDPGVFSAPDRHSPINPVRMAGIFTEAARTIDTGNEGVSGGSGIAVQSCKNLVGRPLVGFVSLLPSWTPGRRYLGGLATLAQKVAFEFPCGWAFERAALPLGLQRSPVTFYLNEISFGQNAYGIQAAALTYFGKNARDLDVGEAAMLAGLPRAPGYLDPWLRPEAVKQRRRQVLESMVRQGYLSPAQAAAIDARPLGVLPRPWHPVAQDSPFVQYLLSWLDAHGFHQVSTSGLTISTTLDSDEQAALRDDVARAVRGLENRGVNNGGAILMNPRDGEIRAWVGGITPDGSPYVGLDMVNQYPHQPGSTIKPLLYSCALEHGVLAPNEMLDDTQRTIGGQYIANWDLTSNGMRPASEELGQSRNTAAAELTRRLSPEGFASCLRDTFHVQTDLHPADHGVKLGLGLAEMPMAELAAAYTPLATGGIYHPLAPVLRVQASDGRELYQFGSDPGERVLACQTTAWIAAALETISRRLDLPAGLATKTGTTPSSAYTVGYGSNVLLAAWVGRTEPGLGRLSIDDVFGREGGGEVWRAVAERWARANPRAPDIRCP